MSAPNVTPPDVEACIASEHYFPAADGCAWHGDIITRASPLCLLTFCVLVTRNGHTVTGEAHCQDPEKFNAEMGRRAARDDAIRKLWPMVVYAAREKGSLP